MFFASFFATTLIAMRMSCSSSLQFAWLLSVFSCIGVPPFEGVFPCPSSSYGQVRIDFSTLFEIFFGGGNSHIKGKHQIFEKIFPFMEKQTLNCP
jgi:hypothetical protein